MQIKTTVDCRCTVRAKLTEDGGFSLRLLATAEYDKDTGGTTSADIEIPVDLSDAVLRAMTDVLNSVANNPNVALKINDAIHVSREAAKREGEIE